MYARYLEEISLCGVLIRDHSKRVKPYEKTMTDFRATTVVRMILCQESRC